MTINKGSSGYGTSPVKGPGEGGQLRQNNTVTRQGGMQVDPVCTCWLVRARQSQAYVFLIRETECFLARDL
jgi:hypothetical protein